MPEGGKSYDLRVSKLYAVHVFRRPHTPTPYPLAAGLTLVSFENTWFRILGSCIMSFWVDIRLCHTCSKCRFHTDGNT